MYHLPSPLTAHFSAPSIPPSPNFSYSSKTKQSAFFAKSPHFLLSDSHSLSNLNPIRVRTGSDMLGKVRRLLRSRALCSEPNGERWRYGAFRRLIRGGREGRGFCERNYCHGLKLIRRAKCMGITMKWYPV